MAGLNDVVLFIGRAESDEDVYDEAGINEGLKGNHASARHIVKGHSEWDEESSIDKQETDPQLPSDLVCIVRHNDALSLRWLRTVALLHLQLSPLLQAARHFDLQTQILDFLDHPVRALQLDIAALP